MHLNFNDMEKIGEKLRNLRQIKGYKQQFIAESIGVSLSTVSRMENEPSKVKFELFKRIAEFYGLELRNIFSDTESECQEVLSKIVFQVSVPTSYSSQMLFRIAKDLEKIEQSKK